ncbi:MAG: pyruvate kinase [Bdellovibrionales bacterium]
MKLADRRVKIVATVGPSIKARENLKKAIEAGMSVARLNFSHGEHKDHLQVIEDLRELSKELRAPVAILQDLQGPKIRVGKFKSGSTELKPGQIVTFSPDLELGEGDQIPTDFKELPDAVQVGTKILLDDGLMQVKVVEKSGKLVRAKVLYGGVLKDRKGMNLPGAQLPVECLTEKDLIDLEFGLKQGVDYVALSFVRKGDDIRRLREIIEQRRPGTKIIAKIEMLEALENLEEIIRLSDAVMVARGDLAVEVGQSLLPGIQKRIINMSNLLHRPVITATQMLDSMVENPRPTRAEITDVANAVIDGSDALMLSAESASGQYPFDCIRTMHEIISEVERTTDLYYDINLDDSRLEVAESIAASACVTALKIEAAAIVCLTTTGKTAGLISHYRPKAKIFAITSSYEALNRLELIWGLQTFAIKPYQSSEDAISQVEEILLHYDMIKTGDRIVVTMGAPVSERAKTNTLRVVQVNRSKSISPGADMPIRCREIRAHHDED